MSLEPGRITLLGGSVEGGGAERRFCNVATHLFGGACRALTLVDPTDDPPPSVASLGWRSSRSYPRMAVALRRHARRHRTLAIFSFGRFPNLLSWAATRALHGRPRLLMSEVSRPWTELERLEPGPKKTLQKALVGRAYRHADLYAANSIDGVEEAVRHLGVDRERTARLPNLLDDPASRAAGPLPCAWPGHDHVFVMAGRLERNKRVDTALRALAGVAADLDAGLLLVGDGPLRAELESLAAELGVASRAHFAGWVENPLPLMKGARACVLASEYEGFSNTLLEAMSLGTPAITSLCSSDAATLGDAGAVLTFAPGDAEGLARAMRRIATTPVETRHMTQVARELAAPHALETGLRTYEDLLRRLLDEGSASP